MSDTNSKDLFEENSSTLPLNKFESDEENINIDERQKWGSRFQFFLACIGYSVGLGNVWRFGYLCAKSGGGAFLIPYFINLLIVAIPLMYMEFSVGQFTQRGPIGAMSRLCPILKGTGIATVVISFFLTTYYIIIITWAIYFIVSSFSNQVPWATCNNEWNTPDCWDGNGNASMKFTNNSKTPSEEFFKNRLLAESSSMDQFGMPKYDLFLLSLVAWVIVYFCIWKGVKSTGKVVYVTAILPYLVIVVFLIRGCSLEGASIGLRFFFIPQWEKLLDPNVWVYAAIQNFNSIGVAFGGLVSMSSYNKKDKRIFGDVLAIACVDAFTSVFCGATVFSILGYIAHSQSKDITEILQQGPGLVFMVIPEAIRNMSISPFWSLLFFCMIFMLGIDSQFTMIETVVTTIEDEFNFYIKKYIKRRELLVLLVCIVTAALSIPNMCPGGIFYFTILDFFSAGISVFYIAFFETIAIVWIYGARRLADNIELMNGQRPSMYIQICWYIVSPLFILIIWSFNWFDLATSNEIITYGEYKFNFVEMSFGWCIGLLSIIAIPLGALHTIFNLPADKTFLEKLKLSIKPRILDIDYSENKYLEKNNAVFNRANGLPFIYDKTKF